ncbi:hypothetical protein ACFO4E_13745 [Nocardiopsis mangrovi]|uniref:Uncharacterized protein n=1 Tax=Nocardiopsis mangrovi TaxID=1179818 RepID=A0ABV9DX02_9ACTN
MSNASRFPGGAASENAASHASAAPPSSSSPAAPTFADFRALAAGRPAPPAPCERCMHRICRDRRAARQPRINGHRVEFAPEHGKASELERRLPGIVVWFGEATHAYWALTSSGLVEIDDIDALGPAGSAGRMGSVGPTEPVGSMGFVEPSEAPGALGFPGGPTAREALDYRAAVPHRGAVPPSRRTRRFGGHIGDAETESPAPGREPQVHPST